MNAYLFCLRDIFLSTLPAPNVKKMKTKGGVFLAWDIGYPWADDVETVFGVF